MTGPERDEFDRMIEQEIADTIPTQGVVDEVNPWHEPIDRIAGGLALTGITLNFLYLQYLLPAVGVVLQYLGFRALRRNGAAFRLAWALSVVRLVWVGAFLVLSVTPWLPTGNLDIGLGLAGMGIQIVQMLALRAGLRQVCRTADIEPKSDPLKAAVCWEGFILVLAFSPLAHSWLAAIPMLIAFVCIVRALFRLGEAMGEAGYCFTAAPVRLNTSAVRWGFLGGCLLLMLALSVCVNHPRLDAAPMEEHGEAEIRQQLADLGLPDEVLADLKDEDVRALDGAFHVACCAEMLAFGPDAQSMTLCDQTNAPERAPIEPEISPGKDTMIASTYYIELPEYRMAVLHRLAWVQGSAYWGDAFSAFEDSDYGYDLIGGRLVYEKRRQTYAAPIPDLADNTVTTTNMFGTYTSNQISGVISYPLGADNPRGYMLYVMQLDENRVFGATGINYYHASQPFCLPYRTPRDRTLGWNDHARLQHYSNFNTQLERSAAEA
ncbi:hypothetical protein ACTQ34_05740 [Agathobaculum sp. LCP25S3_E8]|uniref:hypothetical protein n=1 Tax=Agathobaculum sp. LCP25S3_E8 TaxID=3438735 RepID=UPI003F9059B5